jgi:hypothetical protein
MPIRLRSSQIGGRARSEGSSGGILHRHHDSGTTRYRMREKLFAVGDDFWIETEGGERVFKVDGKALRIRDTFVLKDAGGEELSKAQAKKLHIRDTMEIERDGDTVAAGNYGVRRRRRWTGAMPRGFRINDRRCGRLTRSRMAIADFKV